MKKQSWYDKCYEAFRLTFFVAGLVMIATWGALVSYMTYENHFAKYLEKTAEKSPGELVDLAMAIPGAIVISPHRDLVEMGIIKTFGGLDVSPIKTCSPTVAVSTKAGWCFWEFGSNCHFELGNNNLVNTNGIGGMPDVTDSADGYQAAYESFTKCVSEGNALKITSHEQLTCGGKSCDGMPDDTAAIKKAAKSAHLPKTWHELNNGSGLSLTTTTCPVGEICDDHYEGMKFETGRSCDCDTITSAACGNICSADHSEGIE